MSRDEVNAATEVVKETRDLSIQSPKTSKIRFRGDWNSDTFYEAGDYIYINNSGYFYVAIQAGKSQSKLSGYSNSYEPAWTLSGFVYDGPIQWEIIEITEEEANKVRRWKANTSYSVNEVIVPSSGPLKFIGVTTQYLGFKALRMLVKPNWPILPDETLTDGTVVWETHISYSKLLPPARREEAIYKELCEVMDYLQLHEDIFFNDIIHKFNDRTKVRTGSLNQILGEFGYSYIASALRLSDTELRYLVSYLGMIHFFKGHKSGLELVFELLQIKYHMEEWWEQNPQGEPDTWALYIELDIEKTLVDVINRVVNFTRNYVYPVLQKFELTYIVDMLKLQLIIGGFLDKQYIFYCNTGLLLLFGVAAFIEKEYRFNIDVTRYEILGHNNSSIKFFGYGPASGSIASWKVGVWRRYNPELQTYALDEPEKTNRTAILAYKYKLVSTLNATKEQIDATPNWVEKGYALIPVTPKYIRINRKR